MKKYVIVIVAFIVGIMPLALSAYELIINDEHVEVPRLTIVTESGSVTITAPGVIVTLSRDTNEPPVIPPVIPPVEDSCPAANIPDNVKVSYPVTWGQASRRITYTVGTNVISSRFVTGLTEGDIGRFNFASTLDPYTTRRVWVSECPGGPVLKSQTNCEKFGNESASLRATQRSDFTGLASWSYGCGLALDQEYYLNIEAPTCTDSRCSEVAREIKY